MRTTRDRRSSVDTPLHDLQKVAPLGADVPSAPSLPSRNWTRFRLPMTNRSTTEGHRQASQLELLFDLTFVIAVARIGSELAHSVVTGHGEPRVISFLQVFFAIWWAWMNFTWFASSYDNDDALFRILTMVQMAGALLLATGVPAAFNDGDFGTITYGYLVMRVALGALWVRAGIECAEGRRTAFRYAFGIFGLEALWVARLVLAEHQLLPAGALLPVFVSLVILEMAVPSWAERHDRTSWHPHHIAERYGLFAIILLGEGLLATTSGITDLLDGGATHTAAAIVVAGFALVMALWWLYFLVDLGPGLGRNRERAFRWGYAQYGVFASLAALGAGLEIAVEAAADPGRTTSMAAGFSIAVPVATFLCLLSAVNRPIVGHLAIRPTAALVASACILLLPFSARTVGIAGIVAIVAIVCAAVVVEESVRAVRLEGVD